MSQWRVEERGVQMGVVAKGELVGPSESIIFGGKGRGGRGKRRGRDGRGERRIVMRGREEVKGEKVRGKEEEDVEEVVLKREMVGCFGIH